MTSQPPRAQRRGRPSRPSPPRGARPRLELPRLAPGAPQRQPLLVLGGLVLVLFLGGLAVGLLFLFRPARAPAEPARVAAESFLFQWQAGDPEGAFAQMCADTQARMSPSTFAASVHARPALQDYRIEEVIVEPDRSVAVKAVLTDADSVETQHTFRVVEDRGAWRVCGDPLPTG